LLPRTTIRTLPETSYSSLWKLPVNIFGPVFFKDGLPLLAAGLWESWRDLLTFTIVTVPTNEALAGIHDRMPALLTAAEAAKWLRSGDTALLKPCGNEHIEFWPVSSRVNSPANNDAGLLDRASFPDRAAGGKKRDGEAAQLDLQF